MIDKLCIVSKRHRDSCLNVMPIPWFWIVHGLNHTEEEKIPFMLLIKLFKYLKHFLWIRLELKINYKSMR